MKRKGGKSDVLWGARDSARKRRQQHIRIQIAHLCTPFETSLLGGALEQADRLLQHKRLGIGLLPTPRALILVHERLLYFVGAASEQLVKAKQGGESEAEAEDSGRDLGTHERMSSHTAAHDICARAQHHTVGRW